MKVVNFAQDICFVDKNCSSLESPRKYVFVLNRNRNSWRETRAKTYFSVRAFWRAYKGQKMRKSTHITTVFLSFHRISLVTVSYLSERGL